jgi:hypothetical protein
MVRRKKKKRAVTPMLKRNWLIYRTKGAISIFEDEFLDTLSIESRVKATSAIKALKAFLASVAEHD